MTLRTCLIVFIATVLVAVTLTSTYLIARHQADLDAAVQAHDARVREALRNNGIALARHLSLTSERAMVDADYRVLADAISTDMAEASRARQVQMRDTLLGALLVAALLWVLATGASVVVAARLVDPLTHLLRGIERVSAGDLDTQVPMVKGTQELVHLVTAFNGMRHAIKKRDAGMQETLQGLATALTDANEANRLKSEFLANISHELRTPLNAIVNVPTALLRDFDKIPVWACRTCGAKFLADATASADPSENCPDCQAPLTLTHEPREIDKEKHHRFLQVLQKSGAHLLNVVNDLLDFSKLAAGKMRLYPAEVQIETLFGDLRDTMGDLAREKGLTVTYTLPNPPATLMADPVKLVQIFINLIGNAIKFTPKGGELVISAARRVANDGTWIDLRVRDTGIGIATEQHAAIFERFRQVEGRHARKHGGTGLGLTITKQLVVLHGGTIQVESALGQGATFTVSLPLNGPPQAEAPQPTPIHGAKCRVMVVDDDATQLQLVGMVLNREGMDADLVSNAMAVLPRLHTHRPDCVILDVMMPELSGIDILRKIKADPELRGLPVIVSTAYHSNREAVVELGGLWMSKPWKAYALVAAVRAHAPGHALEAATMATGDAPSDA